MSSINQSTFLKPQISIITPVYNGIAYIESCLQNVIDQKCSVCEHIIIDGGSNDGTVDILRNYATQHSHICWVSEKDQGQSDAMNKGISLAKGLVLGILNVDDYYEPNVLSRVTTLFEQLSFPSFLVGNCKMWDNDSRLVGINKPRYLSFNTMYITIATGNFFQSGLNLFPFNPSAYFYHKEIHTYLGMYDKNNHYTMDFDFIIRVVRNPLINIQYVNESWGNYRLIDNSKSIIQQQLGNSEKNLQIVIDKYYRQADILDKIQLVLKLNLYKYRNNLLIRIVSKIKKIIYSF